ncbi:MAG: hypothetical protein ACREID_05675 [Planctomycetota bacterium]
MDFKELIDKARTFAREHPDEFETVAKDALPLVGNLLLGKFDAVEAEYDRREKAAPVRAAREPIRAARRDARLDHHDERRSARSIPGAGPLRRPAERTGTALAAGQEFARAR